MTLYVGIALILIGLLLYFRRKSNEPAAAEPTGPAEATLEDYFSEITRLTDEGQDDGEFAILIAADKTRFIQVSIGRDDQGNWGYQFDIPNVEWSAPYIPKIELEAKSRGFKPYSIDGTSSMSFLDIDFTDRAAHDAFATWVVRKIFEIPVDARFYVKTS